MSGLKCGDFCSVNKFDFGRGNVVLVRNFSEGFGKGIRGSQGH